MSSPQGMLEGKSITQPPYFNGQHYNWWKNRIENYIQADRETMTMFTRKFKKFVKKTKESSKKKNSSKPRNDDQE